MMVNTDGNAAMRGVTTPADAQESTDAVSTTEERGHFDTVETDFFAEGDNIASPTDALDEPEAYVGETRRPRQWLSRPSLLGLTIASTCLALWACSALWRSNAPLPALPGTAASPARATVAAAPASPPASAAQPATASPASEPSPGGASQPATAPAAPLATEQQPASDSVAADDEVAPTTKPSPEDKGERCRRALRARRNRDILASCPAAFAEGERDARVAIALARIELDRGRFAEAHAWSTKAIAINPGAAEAYVFAGGAEQGRGHDKAAKEAYLQYLRLAPAGRYAAELRGIVRLL